MNFHRSKLFWVATVMVISVVLIASCTKDDQVLNVATTYSTNELLSLRTSTPPTIDGVVDPAWDLAKKLDVLPTVPDPGVGLFYGYVGEKYPATIRSMYDNDNIYFLVEWNDPTNNVVQPWYFDPVLKVWKQRLNSRQYDANGVLIKEGMGQDQLAMLWNIDNSTPKFATQTCYASCHIGEAYKDYTGKWFASKGGNHFTNGAAEKIDMWWCHIPKDLPSGQMDDHYQDWAGGPAATDTVGGYGNGRHPDGIVPPSYTSPAAPNNGPYNNTQSLKTISNATGKDTNVNVPKYVIPDAVNKAYYTQADISASGAAKLITAVSSTGVLTYDGGTIDPNGKSDYYDSPDISTAVGAKCIPSFITSAVQGARNDIAAAGVYTSGAGWKIEIKRKLKTADVLKEDIDFSSLNDQPFGMAIFNSSNYQHGIQPNLLLKFSK